MVADHLSGLEANKGIEDLKEIEEFFFDERLVVMKTHLP